MLTVVLSVGTFAGWGLTGAAAQDASERKAVKAARRSKAESGDKIPLSEVGRPLSEGPTFSEAPPHTVEEKEKLRSRVDALIAQLADADEPTCLKAMDELRAIGHLARLPLEKATASDNVEVSKRAKTILSQAPEFTHIIADAVNGPIPHARVVLTLSVIPTRANMDERDEEPRVTGQWSNEFGQIAIPDVDPNKVNCIAEIQQPEYGGARCEVELRKKDERKVRFPLVLRRSKLGERAAKGTVVGLDGKPVAGAVIACGSVRTAGQGLIGTGLPRFEAVTDEEGRFSIYYPVIKPSETHGEMIPPGSRYDVLITVPADEAYFPVTTMLSNMEPVRVEMPRPAARHRFRFQVADDAWLERPDELRSVYVEWRAPGERRAVTLAAESLLRGRGVLPGTYSAVSHDGHGKSIQFQPLVVDEQSPEELIFRQPMSVTYRGRVVNGVTREPVAGALVIGWDSSTDGSLARLHEEDWRILEEPATDRLKEEAAIALLSKYHSVQQIARSDDTGRFEMTRPPGVEFYGITAFDRHSVPFKVRVVELKPDAEQRIDLGKFLLFPAAKVIVRPVFDGKRLPVSPQWLPTEDGQPTWFPRFQAVQPRSDREFDQVDWLTLNEPQPIFVPAGVRMRLRVTAPYNDEWAPATVEAPFQLEPGASLDLGEVRFAPSLPVEVLVVDPQGRPVEGFAVRRKYDSVESWSVAHNTDRDGKSRFHVFPNSQGKFGIVGLKGPPAIAKAANLTIEFRVAEKAPAEPYRIAVTDEQVGVLRDSK